MVISFSWVMYILESCHQPPLLSALFRNPYDLVKLEYCSLDSGALWKISLAHTSLTTTPIKMTETEGSLPEIPVCVLACSKSTRIPWAYSHIPRRITELHSCKQGRCGHSEIITVSQILMKIFVYSRVCTGCLSLSGSFFSRAFFMFFIISLNFFVT